MTLDETKELGVSQPKVPKEEVPEQVTIEQSVILNPANNNVKTRYPAKDDLTQLQDNRGQAIGCAVSVEKKLTNRACQFLQKYENEKKVVKLFVL